MNIYTAAQMRAYDQAAIEAGIPSMVLMEHAALRVVEFLEYQFAPLKEKRIAIFCGKGNNGGDGLVCARLLHQAGAEVLVLLAFPPDELKGDAQAQYQVVKSHIPLIPIWDLSQKISSAQTTFLHQYDIALDALLGTGFRGEPQGDGLLRGFGLLNNIFKQRIAIDIPSGLNSDDGNVASQYVPAQSTVTLGGLKKGMLTSQAAEVCGEIWIGSIGVDFISQTNFTTELQTIDARFVEQYLPLWSERSVADDK